MSDEQQEVREWVAQHRQGAMLTLTLQRPPANALSLALIATLRTLLHRAQADPEIRVVVLAAAPGDVYCAGHDLKEIRARRHAETDGGATWLRGLFDGCSALMQEIMQHPCPVIAAVDGIASAAGCQLVASCDLAIATSRSRFATPGVNIGGFCSTPMVALSRNVAPKHALQMLLTGEPIDAETALRAGLVNRVVAPAELRASVEGLARRIASRSQEAVRRGKRAFWRQADMALTDAYAFASAAMVEDFLSRDADEGIAAFLEKREPAWP